MSTTFLLLLMPFGQLPAVYGFSIIDIIKDNGPYALVELRVYSRGIVLCAPARCEKRL